MTIFSLLFLVTLFVAYANGANDNFKGVATLYGANVTSYKTAIVIATLATFAGCVASVYLAEGLVNAFSGRGLVPNAIAASPVFLLSVATGAGTAVILATIFGFPVSTTHSLVGGLIGTGFLAAGDQLNLAVLGSTFVLPLLLGPIIAVILTIPLYTLANKMRIRSGITHQTTVHTPAMLQEYSGTIIGITAQRVVDNAHFVSAASVSFARGLNDTPKIVGLLFAVKAFNLNISMLTIACAMAIGGLVSSRKVGETMAKKISAMNDGQALTANLVTALLIISATRFGLPLSTTHVSVGAISGIGIVNKSCDKRVIGSILLSWLLTLPTAAAVSAIAFIAYSRVF